MILHEWLAFYSVFLNIHQSGVLTALTWLAPHEIAVVSVQVLCTPYSHAWCHFMQSCMRKVYACLAVTCHLHFWQNDQDLLHATAVTWGWNGYWNKSQHRKLTLENRILLLLLQGFEPVTFQSQVRRSNHSYPAPWDIYPHSPPPCTPTHIHKAAKRPFITLCHQQFWSICCFTRIKNQKDTKMWWRGAWQLNVCVWLSGEVG